MHLLVPSNVLRLTTMNPMPFPGLEKLTSKRNQDDSEDEKASISTNGPTASASTAATAAITSLEPNDVILGRGFRFAWHSGNNAFQALVQSFIPSYDTAKRKTDKSRIVQRIYDTVTTRGRFVKKDEKSGLYFAVEEHIAKEKIGQAIRYKKRRSGDTSPPGKSPSSSPMPAQSFVAATAQENRKQDVQPGLFDDDAIEKVLGAPGEVEWPDLSQFESLDQPPLFNIGDQPSILDVLSGLNWDDPPGF